MAESIQIKRAQTEELVKNTPLKDGEMAYAKDTGNLFIGTNNTAEGNEIIGAKYINELGKNIEKELSKKVEKPVTPKDTNFFTASSNNILDYKSVKIIHDRFPNQEGKVVSALNDVSTITFKIKENTKYTIKCRKAVNRGSIAFGEQEVFETERTYSSILASPSPDNSITFVTTSGVRYAMWYFLNEYKDYQPTDFLMCEGECVPEDTSPTIVKEFLPDDIVYKDSGLKVLIFGDSISDCRTIEINKQNQTVKYTAPEFDNSYVNKEGETVNYFMWPTLIERYFSCKDLRCYAFSGATFKDDIRVEGNERQNVSYQIEVAFNDLANPLKAFPTGDFIPDVVIFALGTNDGSPNDTVEQALEKNVYKPDGESIDVEKTIQALNRKKFYEAMRYALLSVRLKFPGSYCLCALPVQCANNINVTISRKLVGMTNMALRCGYSVINNFGCGIIREGNVFDNIGTTLKDGLHPNDLGQKLMGRSIAKAIENGFLPLEVFDVR